MFDGLTPKRQLNELPRTQHFTTPHLKENCRMNLKLLQSTALATLALLSAKAGAHEGHGLQGAHWHPTDAWGFVALVSAIAVALWLSRGGK